MDRKTLKNIWIALLIITLVSGYLYFFWTPQRSPARLHYRPQGKNIVREPQEPPETTNIPRSQGVPLRQGKADQAQTPEDSHGYPLAQKSEIPALLVIDNHSYSTTVPTGASVYDLMQIIRKEYPFTFSGKEYSGLGFFVEEINGVKNNTQEGRYWIYYINDKKAQAGVSNYIVQSNDIINWKYEHEND